MPKLGTASSRRELALNAPPHANTTPHIAFPRHLIARLESQPDTPFPGQLERLKADDGRRAPCPK